ncbi:hypothetical protein ACFL4N_05215, partial [Thermodesulfobacteriota bacterium]
DQQPMASLQIKILVSIAAVSSIYAFVCKIRLSRKASNLENWLQKERPDLWSELNKLAGNWAGGQAGLKVLYRRNVAGLPNFNQQYEPLHSLERHLLLGIVIGLVCIGLVLIGTRFWGWHW